MTDINDSLPGAAPQQKSSITLLEFNRRISRVMTDPGVMNCWVVAETTDVRFKTHCYLELLQKNATTCAT